MRYTLLFLALCLGIQTPISAQEHNWKDTDEELAIQFYQNGEWAKARPLFEDLLKDGNEHLNSYYFDCLVKLEDFKEAERFVKKLIRKSDATGVLMVDLAYVYFLQGDDKALEKQVDDISDEIPASEPRIQAIASAYERRGFDDYAFDTYLQGRKILNNPSAFTNQLATLYADRGEIAKMTEEYLQFLVDNPSATDVVKTAFAKHLQEDGDFDIMKNTLLKRIQANPQESKLVDVLSWLFVSKGEFLAAYMQLKALDKRLNEGGKRLHELAKVCIDNKEYNVAEKCYTHIVEQGRSVPYFYVAKLGLIDVKYLKVTQQAQHSTEELLAIEKDFEAFVSDNGIPVHERWEAYLRLAEIRAVYLGKYQEAIDGLEEVEESPRVTQTTRGRVKIDLGNYYLLMGDMWEASLKYSQVEKMFRDHPLGHEAKFLNAKLAFYRGEFDWAKAQLDVLKGSTSELIANDALQLSLLIQDNLALDSITTPLELYAKADKFIFMHRYDDAVKVLDTIINFFPKHSLHDEILMAKGRIYQKKNLPDSALVFYKEVFTSYPDDILADDALYRAANILQYDVGKEQEALKLLDFLIFNYTDSVYGVDARERYRVLRQRYPEETSPANP